MRVAIVYPIEFGDNGHVGGGERYALELARALARKTSTRMVTFGASRRSHDDGPLRVEVFPRLHRIKGRLCNPANPSFLNALRDADVIHCVCWNVLPTDLAVLYARAARKPVFVSDVGGGADFTLRKYLPLDRLVTRFLFLSEYGASLYPHLRERSAVIYGGADPSKFSPVPTRREAKVLYAGRIIPAKGLEYLIDAVDPRTPLTILGRPYDAAYHALLQRRAEGRNVRFITDADDDRLVSEYRTSVATVFPSVKRNAFSHYESPNVLGLTILESMACGTPVVCTDVGPERELVDDGHTGFVVPPNDSEAMARPLARLLADLALCDRMGATARERVLEQFTWEKTAERCLAAYGGARG